jgi:hypothetical protein
MECTLDQYFRTINKLSRKGNKNSPRKRNQETGAQEITLDSYTKWLRKVSRREERLVQENGITGRKLSDPQAIVVTRR